MLQAEPSKAKLSYSTILLLPETLMQANKAAGTQLSAIKLQGLAIELKQNQGHTIHASLCPPLPSTCIGYALFS